MAEGGSQQLIPGATSSRVAPLTFIADDPHDEDFDEEPERPKVIKIYTVNPCICCCCYGGFCNLKRSSIIIAVLEFRVSTALRFKEVKLLWLDCPMKSIVPIVSTIFGTGPLIIMSAFQSLKFVKDHPLIVGVSLVITAVTQYFRYVQLPREYEKAAERKVTAPVILAIKNAILCAVFLGGSLIFCSGLLTFAIVMRSAAASFFNACITFLTTAPTLALVSFFVIALNAISDLQGIQNFPRDERTGYNDRKSWYISITLVAGMLATLLLIYLSVCAWALGMQMVSNTDDRPFTFPTGIIRITPSDNENDQKDVSKPMGKKGFFGGISSKVFGNQSGFEWPQTITVSDFKKPPR